MTAHNTTTASPVVASPKLRLAAFLLCLIFFICGIGGIHRFYVGKIGTGLLSLFTLGGLGIWALIDLIFIGVGHFEDEEGRRLVNWTD